MSGGHFDYNQYHLSQIADEVEHLIESNDDATLNEWGDRVGRGYSQQTIERFREALVYLRRAAVYAQRIDWLVSCDDDEESFHRRLDAELAAIEERS